MSKQLKRVLVRSVIGMVVVLAVVFIAAVAVGYFAAHGSVDADRAVVWIMAPFAVVAMIGAFWIGAAWMRSIDEAAQEAHKAAWYWGGTAGMALGGVPLILTVLPQAETLDLPALAGRTDPAAYMATGAFAMMMLMTLGYIVVWAWWWLRRG